MAGHTPPPRGKVRTREHVIADLAVNHVERQVLLCGHVLERVVHDYGIDLAVVTFNPAGEVENGLVLIQVKATERSRRLASGQAISFRVDRADLQHWLGELLPIILIVYDVARDVSWWVYVQEYFRALPGFNLFRAGKTITVHLPIAQTLTPAAIGQFTGFRDAVYGQHRPK